MQIRYLVIDLSDYKLNISKSFNFFDNNINLHNLLQINCKVDREGRENVSLEKGCEWIYFHILPSPRW